MRKAFVLIGALVVSGCHAQLDAQCARTYAPEIAPAAPPPAAPEAPRAAEEPPVLPQAEPEYVDVPASPPGEPVASVEVFYTQLAPYGAWYDDAEYGHVFVPARADYVPYADGHWASTAHGWTWVSNEPFGWAVCHYGRWVHKTRWVWVPDVTWGPAWVEWRETDRYVGWAPLPAPGITATAYATPAFAWRFVEPGALLELDLRSRYLPPDRVPTVARVARPVRRFVRVPGAVYAAGPSPEGMRARYGVVVQPAAERERDLGRFSARERQDADRRVAEWRRAEAERMRVEAEHRAVEERRRAEAQRHAAEEQAKLEAQRHAAEEQARLEAQRHAAEEQRRQAELQRRTAEEQQRVAAQQRAYEEQQRVTAQQRAFAEQQQRAMAEQQRIAAQQRAVAEQQQRAAQQRAYEEQQRIAAQQRAMAEQQQRATAEQQRRAAEEQQRRAAEEQRRRVAEQKAAEQARARKR